MIKMPNNLKFDTVYQHCRDLLLQYKEKAIATYSMIPDDEKFFKQGKEEVGIQSRYLHRGVYCPSPIIEHVVTNIKRGKIATKIGNVKNPTNHYIFDTDNRLRISETYFPNNSVGTEYIFYEENIVWGVEYTDGHLYHLSVEEYDNGCLCGYLLILCDSTGVIEMNYECYDYSTHGYLDVSHYRFLESYPHLNRCRSYRFRIAEDGSLIWDC